MISIYIALVLSLPLLLLFISLLLRKRVAVFADPAFAVLLVAVLVGVCTVDQVWPYLFHSAQLPNLLAKSSGWNVPEVPEVRDSKDTEDLPNTGNRENKNKAEDEANPQPKENQNDKGLVANASDRKSPVPDPVPTPKFPDQGQSFKKPIDMAKHIQPDSTFRNIEPNPPEPPPYPSVQNAPETLPKIPPKQPQVEFFQTTAEAKSVAYVVDCSSSMSGSRFQRAVDELKRSIGKLQTGQEFFVTFFSSHANPMFNDPRPTKLYKATDNVLKQLHAWLNTVDSHGGTKPEDALQIASLLKPEVIYLLSDGQFNPLSSSIQQLLRQHDTEVHTIAFESSSGAQRLKHIAEQNNGTYRFVSQHAPQVNINFASRLTTENEQRLNDIIAGATNSWELAHGAGQAGPALMEELFELLREPDSQLREDVRKVLVDFTGGVEFALADNASPSERDEVVQKWQAWFLAETSDGFLNRLSGAARKEQSTVLNHMMESPNVHERLAAARYVSSRSGLIGYLLTLVVDKDPDVRAQVKPVLVEMAGNDFGPPNDATEADLARADKEWRRWLELVQVEKGLDLAIQLIGPRPEAAKRRLLEIIRKYPDTEPARRAQGLINTID